MPFWRHDGIRFRYREEGDGLPFVFQHGLGGDADAPFALFPPPAGVRQICLECRAHGATAPADDPDKNSEIAPAGDPAKISFDSFADDVIALLDHLGIPLAVIGGTSMGAGISLNLALRYPERVKALVLSRAAWLDDAMPVKNVYLRLAGLIRTAATPEEGEQAFRNSPEYRELAPVIPDGMNNLAAEFHRPHAKEQVVRYERMPVDAPSRDRRQWTRISVPTLVLATRHDPIHPYEFGTTLANLIPGARFQEVTAKLVDVGKYEAEVRTVLKEFLAALQ